MAARHVGCGPVTPGDLAPADRPETLPVPRARGGARAGRRASQAQLEAGSTLRDLREQVADLAVALTLQECGGNVRAAAARLGVTDRALHLRRAQNRNGSSGRAEFLSQLTVEVGQLVPHDVVRARLSPAARVLLTTLLKNK